MKATPNRSLAGKARKNHVRSRAARLYARQWIEESLYEDEEDTTERSIPIRGRREFLPTVTHASTASMNEDNQLELPLGSRSGGEEPVRTAASAKPAPSGADKVIRFPTRSTLPAGMPFKPPVQFHSRARFTIGGFLLGCAMGSAAAAALLLVVRVAFL